MSPVYGPGGATWVLDSATRLHNALDRIYRLGVSLPDAPLARFETATSGMPRTPEVERLVVQRVGQEIGRAHVCTPVTNAHLVCRLLLVYNTPPYTNSVK